MDLRELSSYIINKLDCDAEVFCVRSNSLLIESRDQKVTLINKGTELGISLRVIKDGKAGFSFSSGGDPDDLIKRTLDISAIFPYDENNIFPGPSPYTEMNIFDPQIASVPVETKIELTKAIEKAAYNLDPRIKKTENTGYCESESEVHIRNTKGIDCSYTSNYCGGFAQVISSSGEGEEEGYYYNFKKKWKGLDPVQTGEKAAAKAMALLDGRTIKSGKLPVVLDNETAAEMLEVISGMISADATQKGKSLFAGKTGKQIASATVSITDDGTLADRTGTSPFDDEGVPKRRNIIVEDGVLNSFLYNVYTASKDKTKSTGNGKRASFKYPPVIGPNNMFVEPGTSSREKIISKITKGILIMRLMALHTINPVSGDFSLGAAGLMIENGKTTYPVRGITISGNLIELLRSVEEIGNDLEFFAQADNCGSPSLLIGSLDVSGN